METRANLEMTKRFICMFMSLLLVIGAFPVAAFGETSIGYIEPVEQSDGTVILIGEATCKGVTAHIEAPDGAFPYGTELVVTSLDDESLDSYVDSIKEKTAEEILRAGFDISFRYQDVEIQPKEGYSVELKFTVSETEDDYFNVWHIDGETREAAVLESVQTDEAGNSIITVAGTEFSVYLITEQEYQFTTYNFYNEAGTSLLFSQKIKSGDRLLQPETPYMDEHHKFTGWYVGPEKTALFTAFDKPSTSVSTVNLYAKFEEIYYVYFMEKPFVNAAVFMTQIVRGSADTVTPIVTDHYKSLSGGADYFFRNWYYTTDIVNGSKVENNQIEINQNDVILYPDKVQGYWIYFDSLGGSYCVPEFVGLDSVTEEPEKPSRPGYTFVRWAANEEGTEAYQFGKSLVADKTVYAVWTPNSDTSYTVVHWLENADFATYSFYKAETKKGSTGSNAVAAAGTLPNGYQEVGSLKKDASDGHIIYTKDGEGKLVPEFYSGVFETATIEGDGSTVVNVYYKRGIYQVKFYDTSNVLIDDLTITARYGEYIGDKWPSRIDPGTYGANWRTSKSGSVMQAGISVMPLGGSSFWQIKDSGNEFNIYFYTEQTAGAKDYALHHTDKFKYNSSALTITEEDHYPINGFTWTGGIDKNGSRLSSGTKGVTFQYNRNMYKVTYVDWNWNTSTLSKEYDYSSDTQQIAYESDITNLANHKPKYGIAQDGGYYRTIQESANRNVLYDFMGWYDNEDGYGDPITGEFYANKMPSQDLTLYACYKKRAVKAEVHLTVQGMGDEPSTYSIPLGTSVAENIDDLQMVENDLMEKKAPGTTWIGWVKYNPETDSFESFNIKECIQSDTIIYPQFVSANDYSVKYNIGEGASGAAPSYPFNFNSGTYVKILSKGGITAPAGKVFIGWSDGEKTYYPNDCIYVDRDILLTAVWGDGPKQYALKYNSNLIDSRNAAVIETSSKWYEANANVTVSGIKNLFTGINFPSPDDEVFFAGWGTNTTGAPEFLPNDQVLLDDSNTVDGVNVLHALWNETLEVTVSGIKDTIIYDGQTHTSTSIDQYVTIYDSSLGKTSKALASYNSTTKEVTFEYYRRPVTIPNVVITGQGKDVGTYAAVLSGPDYVIDDYTGVCKMLNVYYVDGEIDIQQRELSISGNNRTEQYTGEMIESTAYSVTGLLDGDTLQKSSVAYYVSGVAFDTVYYGTFTKQDAVILNSSDVTENYRITYTPGKLIIKNGTPITVTVVGHHASSVYNGKEQTLGGYEVVVRNKETGALLSPHFVTLTAIDGNSVLKSTNVTQLTMTMVTPAASQFEVNSDYKLIDEDIYLEQGYFEITPKPLTIIGQNKVDYVNGSAVSVDPSCLAIGLVSGHVMSAPKQSGSRSEEGTTEAEIGDNLTVTANSQDVSSNYCIEEKQPGSLTLLSDKGTCPVTISFTCYDSSDNQIGSYTFVSYGKQLGNYTNCTTTVYEYEFLYGVSEDEVLVIPGYTYNYSKSESNFKTANSDNLKRKETSTNSTDLEVHFGSYYRASKTKNATAISSFYGETGSNSYVGGSTSISLYYDKDTDNTKVPYTIHYFMDGELFETKTAEVAPGTVITRADDSICTTPGYQFVGSVGGSDQDHITVTQAGEPNVMYVYYEKIPQEYEYRVEHYYMSENAYSSSPDKVTTGKALVASDVLDYTPVLKTGYILDTDENAGNVPLTISSKTEENVIKVYYKQGSYEYSVQYFFDGVPEEKITDAALYGSVVSESAPAEIGGYKLLETPKSITICDVPSSNEIKVYYVPRTDLTYTVHYVDTDNASNVLRPDKTVEKQTFGTTVTETAAKIAGYLPVKSQDSTFINFTGSNEITFEYEIRSDLGYTVKYVNQNGTPMSEVLSNSAFATKTVSYTDVPGGEITWLETYVVSAPSVTDYSVDAAAKSIKITSENTSENVITFVYTLSNCSYTVKYVLEGTNEEIAKPLTITNRKAGEVCHALPDDISGYTITPADNRSKDVTITEDSSVNVVVFSYYRNIIFSATSRTTEYNGQLQGVYGYEVKYANGGYVSLPAGITVAVTNAEGTDITTDSTRYYNEFTPESKALNHTVIGDNMYVYAMVDGELVITKRDIIVGSNSRTEYYSGNEITAGGIYLISGSLMPGDEITADVTGSQTNVGSSLNAFDNIKIINGDSDRLDNYRIITVPGLLTVEKVVPGVLLTTGDYKGKYDGAEHTGTDAGFSYTYKNKANGLAPNFDVVPSYISSITHAGSVKNELASVAIYAASDTAHANDLSENFDIVVETGTLTVNPVDVVIDVGSKESNSPITSYKHFSINGGDEDNFPIAAEKSGFQVNVTGSQTSFGSSENTATVEFDGIQPGDYSVLVNPGTLTYYSKTLYLEMKNLEVPFNGESQGVPFGEITDAALIASAISTYIKSSVVLDTNETITGITFNGYAQTGIGTYSNALSVDSISVKNTGTSQPVGYRLVVTAGSLTITGYTAKYYLNGESEPYAEVDYGAELGKNVYYDSNVHTLKPDGYRYQSSNAPVKVNEGTGNILTLTFAPGQDTTTVQYQPLIVSVGGFTTPPSAQIPSAVGSRIKVSTEGCLSWEKTSNMVDTDVPGVFIVNGNIILANPAAPEGKIFLGWIVSTDPVEGIPLFTPLLVDDVKGNPEDPQGKGDGTPDIYQIPVHFEIKNGKWNDLNPNKDSKTVYITRFDEDDKWTAASTAAARLSFSQIPSSMIADPGYSVGFWSPATPHNGLDIFDETSFEYQFEIETIHDVALHPNGGVIAEGKNVTSYKYGSGATLPGSANITKEGYDFVGWYGNEALTGPAVIRIGVTSKGSFEFWASWAAIDIEVEFPEFNDPDEDGKPDNKPVTQTAISKYERTLSIVAQPGTYGGLGIQTISLTTNVSIGTPQSPEGKGFFGWKKEENPDTGNITLTAIYLDDSKGGDQDPENDPDGVPDEFQKPITYKIVNGYWSDAASSDKAVYVTLSTAGGTKWSTAGSCRLDFPTGMYPAAAYTGAGVWTSEAAVIDPSNIVVKGTGSAVFKYTYSEPRGNDVTLYENGGHIADGHKLTNYVCGNTVALPTAEYVTKAGYTFAGWYTNAAFTGSAVTSILSTDTGDLSFYASWTAIDITIDTPIYEDPDDDIEPEEYTTPSSFITKYDRLLTIDPNGGTYNGTTAAVTTVLTTNVAVTSATAVAGKSFCGWRQEVNPTTGNITLTAIYMDDVKIEFPKFDDPDEDGKPEGKPTPSAIYGPYKSFVTIDPNGGTYNGTRAAVTFELTTTVALTSATAVAGKSFYGWKYKENPTTGKITFTAIYMDDVKIDLPELFDPDDDDKPEGPASPSSIMNKYGMLVSIDPNGGTYAGITVVTTFALTTGFALGNPTAPSVKMFVGWKHAKNEQAGLITFTAIYEDDSKGGPGPDNPPKPGEEPDPDNTPDGTPDSVQKKIILKVVNGTWSDAAVSDKAFYVTLVTGAAQYWDCEGTTSFALETGMLPDAYHTGSGVWTLGGKTVNPVKGKVTASTTATAVYTYTFSTYRTYSVKLVTNGGIIAPGKGIKQYTCNEGATLPAIGEITKPGYIFNGWYKDEEGTNGPVEAIGPKEKDDKIFYASWTAIDIKIDYPEFYDPDDDNEPEGPSTPTSLISKYDNIVTINPNGGKYKGSNKTTSFALTTDVAISKADVQAPKGMIFVGWKKEVKSNGDLVFTARYKVDTKGGPGADNPPKPGEEPDPDKTPDGTPDDVQKRITFRIINGTWSDGTEDDKVFYVTLVTGAAQYWDENGTTEVAFAAGMNPDYRYEGTYHWYKESVADANVVSTSTFSAAGTSDILYICKFIKRLEFTVTLVTQGGTISSGKDVTKYICGDGAVLPTAAEITRAGYSFNGWFINPAGTGEPVTSIGATETEDKQFYASWTAIDIKIDFPELFDPDDDDEPEGPASPSSIIGKYDQFVSIDPKGGTYAGITTVTTFALTTSFALGNPAAPTDKIFVGWKQAKNVQAGIITFTAIYKDDSKGGPGPDNPPKPGEEPDPDNTPDGTPDDVQKKIILKVVNGTWSDATVSDKAFYVTLVTGAAQYWDSEGTTSFALETGMLPDAYNTGSGVWTLEGNIVTPVGNMVTVSTTATAVYTYSFNTSKTNAVKLVTNGGIIASGKDITQYTCNEGATLPAIGEITKPGYIFNGWYKDEEGTDGPVEAIGPDETGDRIFYASWTAIDIKIDYPEFYDPDDDDEPEGPSTPASLISKYDNKVTINPNGGKYKGSNKTTSFTLTTDVAISKADIQAPKGMIFIGWKKEVKTNGDLVFTARYKVDTKGGPGADNPPEPGEEPDPDKTPDGTPDDVQKKLTFAVVNGSWSDGSTDNKVKYVTLVTGSAQLWDAEGIGTIAFEKGMLPDQTHTASGIWMHGTQQYATVTDLYATPTDLVVSGTDDDTYTFIFNSELTFKKGDETTPSSIVLVPMGTIIVDPNGGSWHVPAGWTQTSGGIGGRYSVSTLASITIPDPVPMRGYKFAGWQVEYYNPETGDISLIAVWSSIITEVKIEGDIATGAAVSGPALQTLVEKLQDQAVSDCAVGEFVSQVAVIVNVKSKTRAIASTVSGSAADQKDITEIVSIAGTRILTFFEVTIEQKITFVEWNFGTASWVETRVVTSAVIEAPSVVVIDLPYSANGKINIQAYRYHIDTAEVLPSTPNADGEYYEIIGDKFIIHSCRFSTFAVGYNNPPSYDPPYTPPSAAKKTITIALTDAKTDEYVKGAEYELRDEYGTVIAALETANFGKAIFTKLAPGNYTLVQTKAAEGYVHDTAHIDVAVESEDIVISRVAHKDEIPEAFTEDEHIAYIAGYPDGLVHPENDITRAEVAVIFYRLMKPEIREQYYTRETNFPDVSPRRWFAEAVGTLTAYGAFGGYKDGMFHAEEPISRAEFAAACARFAGGTPSGDNHFTDIENHWAKDCINLAYELGWVSGFSDGTYKPNEPITRAEVVSLVNNMLKRNPRSAADMLPEMRTWDDNNPNKWYYIDMQEAGTPHKFSRREDESEYWIELIE